MTQRPPRELNSCTAPVCSLCAPRDRGARDRRWLPGDGRVASRAGGCTATDIAGVFSSSSPDSKPALNCAVPIILLGPTLAGARREAIPRRRTGRPAPATDTSSLRAGGTPHVRTIGPLDWTSSDAKTPSSRGLRIVTKATHQSAAALRARRQRNDRPRCHSKATGSHTQRWAAARCSSYSLL